MDGRTRKTRIDINVALAARMGGTRGDNRVDAVMGSMGAVRRRSLVLAFGRKQGVLED